MLNTQLPTTRYNKTDYPNLEDRGDGAPIPIAYGNLHGIIPTCINTATQVYMLCGHAIHAVDEVRDGKEGSVLVLNTDYTLNANKNQITFLSTPLLAATTVYYLAIEADYDISGANHEHYAKVNQGGGTGGFYTIDAGGVWNADTAHHLKAVIYGKESLGGTEKAYVWLGSGSAGWAAVGLRDHADRTRLGQKFTTGTKAFYITRIRLYPSKSGTPTGNIYASILSDITTGAEVQVGCDSQLAAIPATYKVAKIAWPQRAADSGLVADIEGAEKTGAPIVDGADMLEDLVVNRLGKASAILDATALADFKTNRTQVIKAYIDRDMTFGDALGKLEASLLFKLVPLHDGTYAPTVYAAGEPAGTPHFFDEHYLSFKMSRNFGGVKSIAKVRYDENPANQEFKAATVTSNVARFVYGISDTLDVETYLGADAEAAALAASYSGMYETPPLEVTFEVRGYGLNLVPGKDKVKLTRTHAAYAGGTLSGVLFRIVRITKKPSSVSTEIVCVKDDQTY